MAQWPPNRPIPEAFSPPKAVLASSLTGESFTWVIPAWIRRTNRTARSTSRLNTAEDKPYSVSLAMQRAHLRDEAVSELVVDRGVDDDAVGDHADLPLMEERAEDRRPDREIEIGYGPAPDALPRHNRRTGTGLDSGAGG